ncbi:MAG: leucine-rich repeat domain-containing protein [Myxococcota bacterium]
MTFSIHADWSNWDLSFLEEVSSTIRRLKIFAGRRDRVVLPASLPAVEEFTGFIETIEGRLPELPLVARFSALWESCFLQDFLQEASSELHSVNVAGYTMPTLDALSSLIRPSVEELEVEGRRLTCLVGEVALNVRSLTCNSLGRLTDLGFSPELVPRLEELEIESAKKLTDVASLKSLRNLRVLSLEACGTLDTLEPLMNLPHLQEAWLVATKVKDGRMRWLGDRLKAYARARHYDI